MTIQMDTKVILGIAMIAIPCLIYIKSIFRIFFAIIVHIGTGLAGRKSVMCGFSAIVIGILGMHLLFLSGLAYHSPWVYPTHLLLWIIRPTNIIIVGILVLGLMSVLHDSHSGPL